MTQRFQNVLLSAVAATGAGSTLSGDDRETSMATIQLAITGTATVTWEASTDGVNFVPILALNLATGVTSTTATASGNYALNVPAIALVRPNVTAYTSGTVTATGSLVRGEVSPLLPSLVADGQANIGMSAVAVGLFNDSSALYDRMRGNVAIQALVSAVRTTTQTVVGILNTFGRGVHVLLNVTANASVAGLTVIIEGQDSGSGTFYPIASASVAITGTGMVVLKIYPGITVAAASATGVAVSDVLPRNWRIRIVAGDASNVTYSLGYNVIK